MKDGITISLLELFEMLPVAESARQFLDARRWGGTVACPHCGGCERISARGGKRIGYYRCGDCDGGEFTVRTGTIFERSHVPLHKWIYAMYLVVTAPKGISSLQLSKEISVTQKTAWFMLGRLREACGGSDDGPLSGVVEVDETYIGGKSAQRLHRARFPRAHHLAGDHRVTDKLPQRLVEYVDRVLAYRPARKRKKPAKPAPKRRESSK